MKRNLLLLLSSLFLLASPANAQIVIQRPAGGITLPVSVSNGGTGLSTYTTGWVLCPTASTTIGQIDPSTVNYVLTSNGAGTCPSFQANVPGSGANTALSNLASVSINTSFLAQTGVDLGSTTKPFRDLYLFGSGTYATTYLKLTGTPTSTRTWTFQNSTDTVVGRATTDTLTNKTLTGNTAANLISGSGTTVFNTTGTITVPNATDTLVGLTTSDILLNKTLTTPVLTTPTANGLVAAYITKSANFNPVLATQFTIDCLSTAFTVTLPAPAVTGEMHVIKNSQTANTCTVATVSGTIDGTATVAVLNDSILVQADGVSQWRVLATAGKDCGSLTSGGIPYFSSTSTCASSALLAANQLVLGGGAGTAPSTLGSLGTTTTVLHGNAAGAPTYGAIVNGDITNATIAAAKLVGSDIATVGTVTSGTWSATTIAVNKGGTGLTAGTSGGVLAYTASGTLASSAALTANMPVIGGGAGVVPSVGSVSGNTTKFGTVSGSLTSGNCLKADASGNIVDNGSGCNTGAGGATVALDNLASVSINTSLLAQTGVDAGSTTKPFRDLYLFGSGTYSTTYLKFTGTPTSTRTLTFPDATDTIVGRATTDTLTNKTLSGNTATNFVQNGHTTTLPDATGTMPIVIKSSGVAVTNTSTTEANMAVITIPANMLGANGRIVVECNIAVSGVAGNRTVTIRHNTTSGAVTGGSTLYTASSSSATVGYAFYKVLQNANATNSQVMGAANQIGTGGVGNPSQTGSIDTTNTSYININGSVTSGDTMTLYSYTVTFYPGV